MDRLERIDKAEAALREALTGWQAKMWTAMPGFVLSFDPDHLTVEVQLAIQIQQRLPDGSFKWITISKLVDVPVVPARGGKCTLTFPIEPGDECLVVFANRCIDAHWQSGGVQAQIEFRMHDLSDGFALIGYFSQPRRIKNWNTEAAELRSDDGRAYIRLNPTTHDITVETPANLNVHTGGDINMTADGNVKIIGTRVDLNP